MSRDMCPHGWDLYENRCFDCQPLGHKETVSLVMRVWQLEKYAECLAAQLPPVARERLPEFPWGEKSAEEP